MTLTLYFAPLACSLATRIALYEAGSDAGFVEVDTRTQTTEDGRDYHALHALGLVPLLETADGDLLAENAAVLQYVAEHYPAAKLAPTDARGRARLHQWLCFIGTELHKQVFVPLLDRKAPPEVKAYALAKAAVPLAWVDAHLTDRELLFDTFTIADAYLFTVLNWAQVTPIKLAQWPAIAAYMKRMYARPTVARAFAEERALFVRELERRGEPLPAVTA
jgi:glutathione S-transferase